jgi:tight adherence protein C
VGILLVLVFATGVAFALAVGGLSKPRAVKQRLIRLADGSASERLEDEVGLDRADAGWLAKVLAPLANVARGGKELSDGPTRHRLVEAGYRRPNAIVIYMGSRVALALILPVIVLVISPVWKVDELQLLTLLALAVVAGLVGPSYFVDRQRAARQHKVILALPDALDLMVVCVEAGLGVNASLNRISKEFRSNNPILSAEFELVVLETRAGRSTTEALRSLAYRSGVAEVASLVAMLVQTERFGTNLGDTLRVHADSLRVQRMQRAEEMAGKAPIKMMFPTLLIFAATLLVTLGPGMLALVGFFAERE